MPSDIQNVPVSKKRLWAGRIISALPILLLLFSGVMKLLKPPSVLQGFADYGYPEHLLVAIGLLEIACTVVYAIPRTSVLGAILVTAYMGGATASNVRVGNPAFIMTSLLGVLAWLGLYLRDERLRALFPCKNSERSWVTGDPRSSGLGRIVIRNMRQLPEKKFLDEIGGGGCADSDGPAFERQSYPVAIFGWIVKI